MKRFFGMMPSSEIEREERNVKIGSDPFGVTIQAGPNGWTILYADHSSEYKDVIASTDDNFNEAIGVLKRHFEKE